MRVLRHEIWKRKFISVRGSRISMERNTKGNARGNRITGRSRMVSRLFQLLAKIKIVLTMFSLWNLSENYGNKHYTEIENSMNVRKQNRLLLKCWVISLWTFEETYPQKMQIFYRTTFHYHLLSDSSDLEVFGSIRKLISDPFLWVL